MTPQSAKLVRILSLIALAFIVGCLASCRTIKQSLTVGPVVKQSLIAQPTVAKSARVAPPPKPPMTNAAICWGPAGLPDDTMGAAVFVVYKATNLLQPQWRYLIETYETNVLISTTQSQQGWFKVESYRLAVGMRWPK